MYWQGYFLYSNRFVMDTFTLQKLEWVSPQIGISSSSSSSNGSSSQSSSSGGGQPGALLSTGPAAAARGEARLCDDASCSLGRIEKRASAIELERPLTSEELELSRELRRNLNMGAGPHTTAGAGSSSSNVSAEDAARTAEEDGIRIAADIAANVIDADAKAGKDVTGTSVVAAPAETLPPALRVRSEIDVKAGGLAPRAEGCDACALCDDVCGNAACAACVMKQRRVEEEREKRAARGCSKRVYTMCQVRRHQR